MRKTILADPAPPSADAPGDAWLNLDALAKVEVSSEEELFPIEQALSLERTSGWRAGATGPQIIRLLFDQPVALHRIQLHFVEQVAPRTQEFSIGVATGEGQPFREVLRQQFTFSPQGTTDEREDYAVDLTGVTAFELRIDPDRSHDPRRSQNYATLESLGLA